jgi:large subunit ribosomal protein L15
MLQLNNLTSITKKRKRVGRGGDRGGTSGKGHKGQKARSGPGLRRGFEGGQMPKYRRLPKRGFNNAVFTTRYEIVNLADLERTFENGATVNAAALIEKGLIKPGYDRTDKCYIKVLGTGTLTKKLTIFAHAASETAKAAVEKAGGEFAAVAKLNDLVAAAKAQAGASAVKKAA